MDKNTLVKMLQDVARLVAAAIDSLNADEPVFPMNAVKRMREKICLDCGDPLEKPPIRGCCTTCYRRKMRAFETGAQLESDEIAAGKIAPIGFRLDAELNVLRLKNDIAASVKKSRKNTKE